MYVFIDLRKCVTHLAHCIREYVRRRRLHSWIHVYACVCVCVIQVEMWITHHRDQPVCVYVCVHASMYP
jgi:hypothetical protein